MGIIRLLDIGLGILVVLFAFLFAAVGRISLFRTVDVEVSGYNLSKFSSMQVALWDFYAVPNLEAKGFKNSILGRVGRFS